MAINVNTVYQTVLLILNKEQRGYMTPAEFNRVGTQVQLQIFEKYFEDLNQQLRVPQTNTDYADRVENLDDKIAIFKTYGTPTYDTAYFTLPTADDYGQTVSFYRLGTVLYNTDTLVDRVDRTRFYYADRSRLTKPTKEFPVYLYENEKIYVKPTSIISDITIDYIRQPREVVWGFNVGNLGQYTYNPTQYDATDQPTGSQQFELHASEQAELILKILMYAGIVIRDPQVIEAAAAQVQSEEINTKS